MIRIDRLLRLEREPGLGQRPVSSAWAIGTLAGAAVVVNGITRIAIAAKIRSGVGQFEQAVKGAA